MLRLFSFQFVRTNTHNANRKMSTENDVKIERKWHGEQKEEEEKKNDIIPRHYHDLSLVCFINKLGKFQKFRGDTMTPPLRITDSNRTRKTITEPMSFSHTFLSDRKLQIEMEREKQM